jgi:hypothetical protein
MKVFVAEAQRHGNDETHHYLIGVYSTETQAKFAGNIEESWRGGKYVAKITEMEIDAPVPQKLYDYHYQLNSEPLSVPKTSTLTNDNKEVI